MKTMTKVTGRPFGGAAMLGGAALLGSAALFASMVPALAADVERRRLRHPGGKQVVEAGHILRCPGLRGEKGRADRAPRRLRPSAQGHAVVDERGGQREWYHRDRAEAEREEARRGHVPRFRISPDRDGAGGEEYR